jgi:hypothetical protein
MFSLRQTIDRFQQIREIDIYDVSAQMAKEHEDVLMEMNQDQLLYGRNTEGELLTPGYLDDPYFKTPEAAQRYYNKKVALTSEHHGRFGPRFFFGVQVFPDKPSDTPNLLISGNWFFNHFFINVNQSGHSYFTGSKGRVARKIAKKYDYKVYGLAPQSGDFFFRQFTAFQYWTLAGFKSKLTTAP